MAGNGRLAALQETAEAAAAPPEHQMLLSHTAEQAFFGGPNKRSAPAKTDTWQWGSEGSSTGTPSGRLFRTGVTPPLPSVCPALCIVSLFSPPKHATCCSFALQ